MNSRDMTAKVVFLALCFIGAVSAVPTALKELLGVSDAEPSDPITVNCVRCHDIDTNKLNVHLVPHSHDDVGWLKTVDEYYYGLNQSITTATVHYIITTVVEALEENPDRRFIQVETAFFWLWWKTQDDLLRQRFRQLVNSGQIEIVNAAWSMNDEACVNYQSTIDQFTWGLRIIQDTLGECGRPSVGWQIDPFGHSREQASLVASMGFDGLFFARLDSADREKRTSIQAMDFAWQGSANLEDKGVFTGIFPTPGYYPPNEFCFDVECGDDAIVEDEESVSYNLKYKVELFKNLSNEYAKYLPTRNILIPMGGDFQFMSAEKNFDNMDKLIKAFANDSDLNVFYSTPSCYIQAVNSAYPKLTLKTDDFFPYSSANHSYWGGYFTSRQNFKRFERTGHNVLQVAKQLVSIARINSTKDFESNITLLREVMGVTQHHDSITGTEKAHVTKDYVRQLTRAIQTAEAPFGDILSDLISKNLSEAVSLKFSSCHLANMSICDVSQSSASFVVIVYNPLAWKVDYIVRLPVNNSAYNVTGANGQVESDLLDPIDPFSYVQLDNQTPGAKELVFAAEQIPALGVQVYFVQKLNSSDSYNYTTDEWIFGNNNVNFRINNETNLLQSVTMNNKTLNITQQFLYYKSSNGTEDTDSSGAYIFRPLETAAQSFGNATLVSKIKGRVVDEVKQKFGNYITQIIRVYKVTQDHVQFDWLVGELDISDTLGTEVITRFTVDNFDNNKTFYTDSNGREVLKRVLNERPDYTYNSTYEPIASNYYPVTSKIVIKDTQQDLEVAVLNDRSQGGTSLNSGELELMVHRRTVKDDNKGVGEALNETEFGIGIIARGQHYLVFGSASKDDFGGKTTAAHERITAQKKLLQPWLGLAPVDESTSLDYLQKSINFNTSFLKQDLPENVNILTLEPWANNSYIVRLEHILEQNEDPTLSKNLTVDISSLFINNSFIADITEVALAADRPKATRRYTWNFTEDSTPMQVFSAVDDPADSTTNFSLTPMQIRTFIVKSSDAISSSVVYQSSVALVLLCVCVFKLLL